MPPTSDFRRPLAAHPRGASDWEVRGRNLAALIHGGAEFTSGQHGGIVPHRLPAWAREQHQDALLSVMEKFPAGVALRFSTAAPTVVLELRTTVLEQEGAPTAPLPQIAVSLPVANAEGANTVRSELQPSGADVVQRIPIPRVDAIRISGENVPVGHDRGTAARLEIDLPDRDPGVPVEILLPHTCIVELLALSASASIEEVTEDARPVWVHYGSSISHGLEAASPDRTWPARVALDQGWRLRNLSFAGNAQLDPFLARIIRDTPADLITLKIGINLINADSMRERAFLPALHGFLDTIRERNQAPIVLITAITCPVHEKAPGPTVTRGARAAAAHRDVESDDGALTLSRTRELLTEVATARSTTDRELFLLDGPALFGPGDAGHLADGLHPDEQGLALIASRFPAQLAKVLGGQNPTLCEISEPGK